MNEVSSVVRAIRKRLDLTQVSFAARLGVKQGVVSQYERGITTPSYRVCSLLLELALPNERAPLYQAMQLQSPEMERDFLRQIENFHAVLEEAKQDAVSSSQTRTAFVRIVERILKWREIPFEAVSLVGALSLYTDSPAARSELADAADLLRRRLERMAAIAALEPTMQGSRIGRKRPSKRLEKATTPTGGLARVLILCPQTKKPIDTGWTTDLESWKNAAFEPQRLNCPACHGVHYWKKDEAFLDKAS